MATSNPALVNPMVVVWARERHFDLRFDHSDGLRSELREAVA